MLKRFQCTKKHKILCKYGFFPLVNLMLFIKMKFSINKQNNFPICFMPRIKLIQISFSSLFCTLPFVNKFKNRYFHLFISKKKRINLIFIYVLMSLHHNKRMMMKILMGCHYVSWYTLAYTLIHTFLVSREIRERNLKSFSFINAFIKKYLKLILLQILIK